MRETAVWYFMAAQRFCHCLTLSFSQTDSDVYALRNCLHVTGEPHGLVVSVRQVPGSRAAAFSLSQCKRTEGEHFLILEKIQIWISLD